MLFNDSLCNDESSRAPKGRLFILYLVTVTCILASLVVLTFEIQGTTEIVDHAGHDASATGSTVKIRANILAWLSSISANIKISEYFPFILQVLQAGCQPIITNFFMPDEIVRTTAVFAQECSKFVMSLLFLVSTGDWQEPLKDWSLLSAVAAAGVPAALYVVQNYCNLMANQVLPPVAFVVLNQTKTLSTAWCCFILLGQKQSDVQVLALILLVCSALVVQVKLPCGMSTNDDSRSNETSPPDEAQNDKEEESTSDETESEESALDDMESEESKALLEQTDPISPTGDNADEWAERQLIMGVMPALCASFISGLGELTAPVM